MRPNRPPFPPSTVPTSLLLSALAASACLLCFAPHGAVAQAPPVSPADSSRLVDEAEDLQRDFERFRGSRIPVAGLGSGGRCDERIGRICIWFGGDDETDFPPEPPETTRARFELIVSLSQADAQIGNPWILGQLVRYLTEAGNYGRAVEVSTECGLVDTWWCGALHGYTLHVMGQFVESEAAFRAAMAGLPEDEREWWTTPGRLFTEDGEEDFERADANEQIRLWERLWRFSDPLFLLEGNDRLTDHFARLVEARNNEDAEDPQGLGWDDDLEETLIRYGRIVGWSRTRPMPSNLFGGGGIRDDRQVVGHHHPRSRGYVFPEEFITAPADILPESWITAPRESRTWYAPPYAPDFGGLETQIGRFRRADEMLVVGAYSPAPAGLGALQAAPPAQNARPDPFDPFGRSRAAPAAAPMTTTNRGSVESGLFLVPEDGGESVEIRGSEAEGVVTLLAPPGRYVSSIEVLEPAAARAWRARQGVVQAPVVRGVVSVSDLVILREDAPFPTSLDEAIPNVRPGVRVRGDERFTVVWEVYGLQIQERVEVTLGFTLGRPGFLQRVGELLGVLEPDRPVEVTFGDAGADRVQTAFRAVAIELPDLDPGEYTLHLRLDLPGREPVIASRPITVDS